MNFVLFHLNRSIDYFRREEAKKNHNFARNLFNIGKFRQYLDSFALQSLIEIGINDCGRCEASHLKPPLVAAWLAAVEMPLLELLSRRDDVDDEEDEDEVGGDGDEEMV